ncbi:MAG TPA: peptidoglycan-binding protein [Steroidobacteraceae bacterium]
MTAQEGKAKTDSAPLDQRHRYVLQAEPDCNELPGPHFDFDCTFVRPEGMSSLTAAAAAIEARPHKKAAVFGHTDTAGDETYNKKLSEQRARIVFAALTHDTQPWEERYKAEHWGPRVIQIMLNKVQPGEPLAEDGVYGPRTRAAVTQFQRTHGLATDGIAGPITRKALFQAYMRKYVEKPIDPARFLAFGSEKYMGCGEFNPFTEGVADAASRRVVILLFSPTLLRTPLPCAVGSIGPCKGQLRGEKDPPIAGDKTPHFRCKVYRRISVRCPCGPGVDLMSIRIQLHDEQYRPCGNLEYRLTLASGQVVHGRTDSNGWLRNAVPKKKQVVTVAYTPEGSEQEYSFPVRLTDADPESDDALLCHVFNMGFGRSDDNDRLMLLRFQAQKDLDLTGAPDGPTKEAIRKIIHGADDSMLNELGD